MRARRTLGEFPGTLDLADPFKWATRAPAFDTYVAAVITSVRCNMTVGEEGTFTMAKTDISTYLSIVDIAVSNQRSGLRRRCSLHQVLKARGEVML